MSILNNHSKLERNATLLLVASLAVVTVGGIVEIAPLFYLDNTIEKVEGMRPYSPLELAGRDIYVREGCYVCHSQMIRPFRDEVERYGHYSLAAESMYQAERLRVIGDLRAAWFKLYVLGKQIVTTEADKAQIQSLISTANARIATGNSQPGDVLMATLELGNLEEQLLGFRQQVAATTAEINRLAGRDSRIPLFLPREIEAALPEWNHDLLREVAMQAQPELAAARLRTQKTERAAMNGARALHSYPAWEDAL